MRFLADGPDIPDELLLARDQGRVIFFCGSGVSRAKAELPDFFGLAEQVILQLGVQYGSPAYKLINEAKEIDKRVGAAGIISADRIFGLLEREFESKDIEKAVALTLKPKPDCDLSAHQALIDLATSPEGNIQLVTTNFDRLFNQCCPSLYSWQPPRLPDPSKVEEMNGIVYLHGRTNQYYDGSEEEPFILSSSEFGRAYLADGWATHFFSEIIRNYYVVFIGYSADDPPVQYLLEALNKGKKNIYGAYAFQSGKDDHAASLWNHKGVTAIPYSENNNHQALWDTIDAWSVRASDINKWNDDLITLAIKGPASLQAHERGQIAHMISTSEGAKRFASSNSPPPAEWLCVFDRACRYAHQRHSFYFLPTEERIDPFELYHLDSDIRPQASLGRPSINEERSERLNSWDAFDINQFDQAFIDETRVSKFFGNGSRSPTPLIPRLEALSVWISKKCTDPITAWWVAGKGGLHLDVTRQILWAMGRKEYEISEPLREAWKMIFHAQRHYPSDPDQNAYIQESIIKVGGWDSWSVDELSHNFQPRLQVEPSTSKGPLPPSMMQATSIHDIIRTEVIYHKPHIDIDIPSKHLPYFVKKIRSHIEYAVDLETRIGGHGLYHIDSLEPCSDEENTDSMAYEYGISILIKIFSDLFATLAKHSSDSALEEIKSWQRYDDHAFTRMHIYASNFKNVVNPHFFTQIISGISRKSFWDQQHQRDLLFSLSRRWNELNFSQMRQIEKKILQGPSIWDGGTETLDQYSKRKSLWALNMLHWLHNEGIEYTFNIDEKTEDLKKYYPEWKKSDALSLADSLHGKGGIVQIDPDYSAINDAPISAILPRSYVIKKERVDFLVDHDPFLGLSKESPIKAFRALIRASYFNIYPEWAWRTFLSTQAREGDGKKIRTTIARRMSTLRSDFFKKIGPQVSSWLMKNGAEISTESIRIYESIIGNLINAALISPEIGKTSIIAKSEDPDWPIMSLNSMTGQLARSLFDSSRLEGIKSGDSFPIQWKTLAEKLLSIHGESGIYAYTTFSKKVDFLYSVDPEWTTDNIISLIKNRTHREAFFSAFLWHSKMPRIALFRKIKPDLLALSNELKGHKSSYFGVLSGILLEGWVTVDPETGERLFSNEEMRSALINSDEQFRIKAIWHIGKQGKSTNIKNPWKNETAKFFHEVWPIQISAKSKKVSSKLLNLAFSSGNNFDEIATEILPLLTESDGSHMSFVHFRGEDKPGFLLNPKLALEMLIITLPDDAANWPYDIEKVIQLLEEADKSLSQSPDLISLKRRWQVR